MFGFSNNPVTRMKAITALMLLLTGPLTPLGRAQSGTYPVRIENATNYSIYEVHISRTNDSSWEQDLLGRDTLSPGWIFTARAYPGRYDLKLVDEDGDVCEVHNVAVSGPTNWRITNSWLLNCEHH